LMTVAPALILLGEPLRIGWAGTPLFVQHPLRRLLKRDSVGRFGHLLTNPALCWTIAALTPLIWHLPFVFTLTVQSAGWHAIEQVVFFAAGLFFWWPVLQPWPSHSHALKWSMIVYLFLATLPCDILSGFLVFS